MVNITFGSKKKKPEQKNQESKPGTITLFGQKKPTASLSAESPETASQLRNLERRIRVLEERIGNIRTKETITEHNMLSRHKHVTTEIRTINDDMLELKKEMNELKDRVLLMIKELQSLAKKEDMDVIKRYLEMWEPMRFVTRAEINDIVREAMSEQKDL